MMANLLFCVFVVLFVSAFSQIPCDDAYGAHCPEASGFEVGECLKALDPSTVTLSNECQSFIQLHDTCKHDINTHCAGKEYTGDAMVCLSEWTKPEDLSEDCKNALPKKQQKERKLTAEQKKKADQRRKIRNKAAKMARDF